MKHAAAQKRLVDQLRLKGIEDSRILNAFMKIPRHLFIQDALQNRAYEDTALPIGNGQTISQPSVVGLMLQALQLKKTDRVLDIGAGSGYQTALLSCLVTKVFAIERIPELSRQAQRTLDALGIYNVYLKTFDGTLGWKDEAPFDAIIVAAASAHVPIPYYSQLTIGGRMILPVGDEDSDQQLTLITKKSETEFDQVSLGACRFVKLIGEYGFHS